MQGLLFVVVTSDTDGAGARFYQTFHCTEGRGLAGAIGTEQAEDLAGLDFEGDLADGLEAAIFDIQA